MTGNPKQPGLAEQRYLNLLSNLPVAVQEWDITGQITYANDPAMANHKKHAFLAALPKPFTEAELHKILANVLADRKIPATE
ncbi:PAS domain-containing protein [Malonomonas rubra]|uniref:PAS domain-containing protein n=1 Tax=Malonomonas rubra TaxID=57040 RepID=UPI0026F05DD4|nr:PAS domain-containing protein [Malonomonas rubra]